MLLALSVYGDNAELSLCCRHPSVEIGLCRRRRPHASRLFDDRGVLSRTVRTRPVREGSLCLDVGACIHLLYLRIDRRGKKIRQMTYNVANAPVDS